MLKRLLPLAVVIEAELVHHRVIDRPRVCNVVLLEPLRHDVSEPWEIRTRQFEVCKRIVRAIVVEIVIDAQVLFVVQPVVKFKRHLIAAHRLGRHGADQRTAVRRLRNKLQQVHRRRIHASQRYLTSGKNRRKRVPRDGKIVRRTILYCRRRTVNQVVGRLASRTIRQKRRVRQATGKRPIVPDNLPVEEVGRRRRFRGGWHGNCGRLDPLPDASPFIRGKEECSILLDRSTKCATKLVLIELGLGAIKAFCRRQAVVIGIEYLVAEELVQAAMQLVAPRLGHHVDY